MVARGWERIINLVPVKRLKGSADQTSHAAAKAGMRGFTRPLTLGVARKGVAVNTVSPRNFAVNMVTAIPQEIFDTRILPHIPVGRLGKPDKVAALICYLGPGDAGLATGPNIAISSSQQIQ